MSAQKFDIIVVGVGAMGSAACFHLARRGSRVLGLDAHGIPNDRGSSAGQSRAIRLCYYEHPDYVPLLRRSYELWDELCQLASMPILRRTGGVYIGPPDGSFVAGARQAAETHHLPHEMLDRAALADRFPQFVVPESYGAIYEPGAGFVIPEYAVSAHARLALEYGAELRAHEPVLDWSADDAGAEVRTPRGTYTADHLVFTTGAWTGSLLSSLGVTLTATRQVQSWFWPSRPELFRGDRFVVWAVDDGQEQPFYGFPLAEGLPGPIGLKVARHAAGRVVRVDDLAESDLEPTADDQIAPAEFLASTIPDAAGSLVAMKSCLYTSSPDHHFVLGRPDDRRSVVVACGFSGHGFKFAPVMGEALADLAVSGRTRLPIEFLGVERFDAEPAGDGGASVRAG